MSQVDGSVIISTEITNAQYKRGLADMKKATDAWAKGTVADFNTVSKSSMDLASTIKAGVAAFAGLKIVGLGKEAVMAAARYETLGIVVNQAFANVGRSAEQVQKAEKELRTLGIAAMEARQTLAQMAASGINLDFAPKLARAAQDLAVVAGINSSEAFERLIRGIQSGEQEILKTMGLNVQWEESYKSLATTLGKTVDSLTPLEKMQARTNVVLEKSASYAGIYAASMETAGKQIGSMARYISDLSVKAGSAGLDVLSEGTQGLTKLLKEANTELDRMAESGELAAIQKSIGNGFKTIAEYSGVAVAALTAYTLTQRTLNAEEGSRIAVIKGKVAAIKEEIVVQNQALVSSRERALAAQQEALASQKAAQIRLAALKAEEAALSSAAKQMGGSGNLGAQQAAAFARVIEAERELAAVNTVVATTTNNLSLAQTKATVSARLFAGAQTLVGKAVSGIKSLGAGIMGAFGGPVGLAITGVTAAVTYLMTRQSEAEKVAEKYNGEISAIKVPADEAAAALERYAESTTKLSKAQTALELDKTSRDVITLGRELIKLGTDFEQISTKMTSFDVFETDTKKPFQEITESFRSGTISAEEFRDAVSTIMLGLSDKGRKFGESLLESAGKFDESRKKAELLQNRMDSYDASVKKSAESTTALAISFSRIGKNTEIKSIDDAAKFLREYTKETKLAKSAAEDEQKANVRTALSFYETGIAAAKAAYEINLIAGTMAQAAGASDLAAQHFQASARALAELASLSGELGIMQERLSQVPTTVKKSGGGGPSAAEVIKEIREEIAALNAGGSDTWALKLSKSLDDIETKGKKAGLSIAAIKGLQSEMREGMRVSFLADFNKQLAELEGGKGAAAMQQLAADTVRLNADMLALGFSAEQAAAAVSRFFEATAKQRRTETLETEVNFLKEIEQLSGQYGLSIERQEELIALRADALREELPHLKEQVDLWERLQKREVAQNWDSGITRSAQKFVAEWTNAGKVAEKQFDIMLGAIQSVGESAIDAIFGDAEFRADQFFKDLTKQLLKLAMNQMVAKLFGSLGFGVATSHTGSIVGVPDTNPTRRISLADASSYIPKFHSGGVIGSNERLVLTQTGEGIFTPAQMRALAPATSSKVNITVENNAPVNVATQTSTRPDGTTSIEFIISEVDRSLAQRTLSGKSQTAQAIDRTRNTSAAYAALRK